MPMPTFGKPPSKPQPQPAASKPGCKRAISREGTLLGCSLSKGHKPPCDFTIRKGKLVVKSPPMLPDLKDADLTLLKGNPIHMETRMCPPMAVAAQMSVAVKVGDKTIQVAVYVGVSPWGQIDYLRDREDASVAIRELDEAVRTVASRLEIV